MTAAAATDHTFQPTPPGRVSSAAVSIARPWSGASSSSSRRLDRRRGGGRIGKTLGDHHRQPRAPLVPPCRHRGRRFLRPRRRDGIAPALAGRSRGSLASPRITSSRARSGTASLGSAPCVCWTPRPGEIRAEIRRAAGERINEDARRRVDIGRHRVRASRPRAPAPCTAAFRRASRAAAAAPEYRRHEGSPVPPLSSSTAPGVTSRWMIPAPWSASSAASTSSKTTNAAAAAAGRTPRSGGRA